MALPNMAPVHAKIPGMPDLIARRPATADDVARWAQDVRSGQNGLHGRGTATPPSTVSTPSIPSIPSTPSAPPTYPLGCLSGAGQLAR